MSKTDKPQEIDVNNLDYEQAIKVTIPALRQLSLTFDEHAELETALVTLLNFKKT